MNSQAVCTGPKGFSTAPRKSCVQMGDKSLPSPAEYHPMRVDSIDNPEWVIGTSQSRNSFLDPHRFKNPSPQQYKVNYTLTQKQQKQYSMPLSRLNSRTLQSFAPQYKPELKQTITQQPHYSFGYSRDTDYDNKLPGVGDYQVKLHSNPFNKTQNNFGSADRPLPHGEEGTFPGATKYGTLDFNRTNKYTFSKTERMMHLKNEDPPARFYDISAKKKAPRSNGYFSDSKKRTRQSFLQANQNPSPCEYNIVEPHKIPNGVIQTSKRGHVENIAVANNPGSNQYSVTLRKNGDKSHNSTTFVKEVRKLSAVQSMGPGPGAYEPMKTLSTVGCAMRKMQEQQAKKATPGASSYRPRHRVTRGKAQSTIVFQADRCDFSKTITGEIGPGQYDLKNRSNMSQLGRIGQGRRGELYSPNKNPGVGDYDIPSLIGRLPKYYGSPKKINQNGFSTFHEKLRLKMMQKQRNRQLEEQKSEKDSIVEVLNVSKETELV